MGFLLRKSVKVGPMRINFSNSGISYSVGVKGARLSTGQRGTFVTLGANGIYYRQKISSSPGHTNSPVYQTLPGMHSITSAPIDQLTDVDSKVFIDELSEKASKISLTKWFGIWPMIIFVVLLSFNSLRSRELVQQQGGERKVAVINSFVGSNVRALADGDSKVLRTAKYGEEFTFLGEFRQKWLKVKFNDSIGYVSKKLAGISMVQDPREVETELFITNPNYPWLLGSGLLFFAVLIYFLSRQDKKRFEMELNYEMDEQMGILYETLATHFSTFKSSQRKWQYLHAEGNVDWKRNAGAGKLINRITIGSVMQHKNPIRFFKTNVQIPHIKLNGTELYFLPERLLVRRANKFAALFYKNLVIDCSSTRFIEEESVSPDAKIVGHTWKYVNKNGGPDRRFTNNRQIPICLYSLYTLHSKTGVYETLSTSRIGAFDGFADYLKKIGVIQSIMDANQID
ncbi:hypothetical protein DHW03_01550 [Pedobacter yonginense]|uniref:DUF4236 domain-containing protein n=1 Tax=Pedobacter yonginense TaxID=651869 RepID=A0A317ETJ5_9SPHI|nr:DUF4236 domain-containing protein [Pedobacter yonginense]PWS28566.1 hypothetical protein DHW03_01550 [Pedobacter yonginense]